MFLKALLAPAVIFGVSIIPVIVQAGEKVLGAVRVTQSDGIVMNTDRSIGALLVADPAIANVQPLSDKALFLIGKSVGSTRLFILDDDNQIVEEHRVFVGASLSQMSR